MKTPFHIMIIPTLGCPANCRYCWSSEESSPVMSIETAKATGSWLSGYRKDPVTITFHGGEPLLAGYQFFSTVLPLLTEDLKSNAPSFAIQTNLWKMNDELAELFSQYQIPVGSSLDGPEEITDYQRGDGYYQMTLAGYEIATRHQLDVRFICTFTKYSVQYKEKIVQFFKEKGLTLKLHPALPSIRSEDPHKWVLSPEGYGNLLLSLLDMSLEHPDLDIMNITDLCRCVFTRQGSVCTFADCIGNTFAIGPDGGIYPCYRFVGIDEWKMGSVYSMPSEEDLFSSEAGLKLLHFREIVNATCNDCSHIRYCRGGCPYNALSQNKNDFSGVDPYCTAYRQIFDEISVRMNKEMFESEPAFFSPFKPKGSSHKKQGIMSLIHRMVMKEH
jgi:uncharacterized protein